MNLLDLDTFLKEHTFIEKCSLFLKDNNYTTQSKKMFDSITFNDVDKKKLPLLTHDEQLKTLIKSIDIFDNNTIFTPDDDIIISCHPRFSTIPTHHHPCIEMIYIYSGECEQVINSKKISMKKGEVCLLDPNVFHSINAANENDIIINILISKNYVDNILLNRLSDNDLLSNFFIKSIYQKKSINNYILFNSSSSEKMEDLFKNMLTVYWDKPLCFKEILNSYLVLIFAELLSVYSSNVNRTNYLALNNVKISEILLYIEQNSKTTNLIETAEYFHFHPNYLSKTLKKITGENFTDILHKTRLKKACTLLKNSSISISQISNEVGYSNINFFYTIFKRYYSCKPSEFRERHKNKGF